MRGRPKQPAAVKLAKGTYKADRDAPLDVNDAPPEAPGWLNENALAVWADVVAELGNTPGLLATVDRFALGRYCNDWATYLQAAEKVAAEGIVAASDVGNLYQHPAVGIQNKAHERMSKFEGVFGMTPSARCGMKIDTRKKSQGVRRRNA